MDKVILSPPYPIPLRERERDGAFRRYGVRCIISMSKIKSQKYQNNILKK
jgi:hypothetical protein